MEERIVKMSVPQEEMDKIRELIGEKFGEAGIQLSQVYNALEDPRVGFFPKTVALVQCTFNTAIEHTKDDPDYSSAYNLVRTFKMVLEQAVKHRSIHWMFLALMMVDVYTTLMSGDVFDLQTKWQEVRGVNPMDGVWAGLVVEMAEMV